MALLRRHLVVVTRSGWWCYQVVEPVAADSEADLG
jgi:hypothetical protein